MGPGEPRDLLIRMPSIHSNPASQAMQRLARTPNSTTLQGNRQHNFDRQARNSHNLLDTCYLGQGIQRCCTAFPLQKAYSAPTLLLPSPPRQALSPKATAMSETLGRHLGQCHCLCTEDALLAPNKQESTRRLDAAPSNAASVSCASQQAYVAKPAVAPFWRVFKCSS